MSPALSRVGQGIVVSIVDLCSASAKRREMQKPGLIKGLLDGGSIPPTSTKKASDSKRIGRTGNRGCPIQQAC